MRCFLGSILRPQGTEMRIRKKQILLRLSEKEYAHLKEQADLAGLKIEPFLRNLILGVKMKPRSQEEWAELVRQMSAVGNNINQIAHRANIHGPTDKQTLLNVQQELAKIRQKMDEL